MLKARTQLQGFRRVSTLSSLLQRISDSIRMPRLWYRPELRPSNPSSSLLRRSRRPLTLITPNKYRPIRKIMQMRPLLRARILLLCRTTPTRCRRLSWHWSEPPLARTADRSISMVLPAARCRQKNRSVRSVSTVTRFQQNTTVLATAESKY